MCHTMTFVVLRFLILRALRWCLEIANEHSDFPDCPLSFSISNRHRAYNMAAAPIASETFFTATPLSEEQK